MKSNFFLTFLAVLGAFTLITGCGSRLKSDFPDGTYPSSQHSHNHGDGQVCSEDPSSEANQIPCQGDCPIKHRRAQTPNPGALDLPANEIFCQECKDTKKKPLNQQLLKLTLSALKGSTQAFNQLRHYKIFKNFVNAPPHLSNFEKLEPLPPRESNPIPTPALDFEPPNNPSEDPLNQQREEKIKILILKDFFKNRINLLANQQEKDKWTLKFKELNL